MAVTPAPNFPYPKQIGVGRRQVAAGDHTHAQADLPQGLYLYSPNGKRWLISVSNAGAVTITAA